MAERSFKNYIIENMKEDIYKKAWNFFDDNIEMICNKCGAKENIADISNKKFTIQKKDITLKTINEAGEIEYFVCVNSEFDLCYENGGKKRSNIQLGIKCRSDLDIAYNHIEIDKIKIDKYKENSFVSEELIGYFREAYQNTLAEKILKKYYNWDGDSDIKVNPDILAENMGLTIIEKGIEKDFSIFGQIYLDKTTAKLYDVENDKYVFVDIEPKTIVIDPRIEEYRGEGSKNNTKIHECIHWILHRNAIRFMGNQLLSCNVKNAINKVTSIEQQAESLTPKILMPQSKIESKAKELLDQNKIKGKEANIFVLEKVINQLSDRYGVSKSSVRLRLFELGYNEVLGVLNYVDGEYVPAHCRSDGAMSKDKTFCISESDLLYQRAFSPKLNKILNEESYVYAEYHLCKNMDKYVRIANDGDYVLTDYARTHMEECCIEFDIFYQSSEDELPYGVVLNKGKKRTEAGIIVGLGDSRNRIIHKNIYDISRKMPKDFNEALKFLKKLFRYTEKDITNKIFMSETNFRKLLKGEIKEVQLNTVVSICIAMNLPPEISFLLVKSAGLGFKDTEEHTMLKTILYGLSPVEVIRDLKQDYVDEYVELKKGINELLKEKIEWEDEEAN